MKKSTLLAWAIVLLCFVMSCTSCTSASGHQLDTTVMAKGHYAYYQPEVKRFWRVQRMVAKGDTVKVDGDVTFVVDSIQPSTQGGSR